MENTQCIKDKRTDVGVLFLNKRFDVKEVYLEEGYIRIELKNCSIYCCYVSLNIPTAEFEKWVDNIMDDIREKTGEKIIMGDMRKIKQKKENLDH